MTDEREAKRSTVVLAGSIIHMRRTYPCRIRDVSVGGCRVECDTAFPLATPIHVELSRFGRFPGVVAWVEGRFMGIVFAEGTAAALARFGDRAVGLGIAEAASK